MAAVTCTRSRDVHREWLHAFTRLLAGLILCAAATAFGSEPISVLPALKEMPDNGAQLRIDFHFTIADGVHVYTDPAHSFKIEDRTSQGLGRPAVVLPPLTTIRDIGSDDPQATVQVMTGNATVTVRLPSVGKPGEPWKWEGVLHYQGCTDKMCYPPQAVPFTFAGKIGGPAGAAAPAAAAPVAGFSPASSGSWAGGGLLWGVLAAFVAGLALSLTPCVYPMIGITVAVIGGRNASRGRTLWLTFLYVLGLSLVYALVGVLVALLGNKAAMFFRSAWVLLPVGIVFLLFGLSMFDIFTLQTPAGMATRLQAVGKQGSAPGVFVMGALSAFVVGPCVSAPLLSLLTFVASTGRPLVGFLYFLALAWGMCVILFVAGSAAGLLPKAGAWMETVKHVMGMVLVWGAFYFTRPVIGETAFWVACVTCVGAGLGVVGWFKLPDPAAPRKYWSWCRLALATVILAAAALLVTTRFRGEGAPSAGSLRVNLEAELAKGRPVILDFQAPWCTNCKEIRREVLSKPDVQQRLASFNLVPVDYDHNPELVQQFGVIGPPAFIFLDAAGKPTGPVIVTGDDLRQRLLYP